jgi:hypothetical protein
MKYKARMAFLKVLCVPLVILTVLVFFPIVILTYALYGILHAWRWVVREFIDEELTAAWNELAETIGIDELAIEF